MSLFLFHGFPSTLSPSHLSIRRNPIFATLIPARDRTIDFGKHKGKPLGTLPSKYLKWVSKNLRARDFENWAKLADEVLEDPVYKDRVEWEFAEKILNGDGAIGRTESPVLNLVELSERFGWDNDDKLGWSKIDFELLGTSKGGRIPRRGGLRGSQSEKVEPLGGFRGTQSEKVGPLSGNSRVGKGKLGFLKKTPNGAAGEGEEVLTGKREERIERQRLKREASMHKVGLGSEGNEKKDRIFYDDEDHNGQDQNQEQMVRNTSKRFPGREGLIKKVLNNRRPF